MPSTAISDYTPAEITQLLESFSGGAAAKLLAAAPAEAKAAAAATLSKPTYAPSATRSLVEEVRAICAAAQAAAFPDIAFKPTDVQASKLADYQNNAAMGLFGQLKGRGALPDGVKSPRDVGAALAAQIGAIGGAILAKHEVAGPGFINLWLSPTWLASRVQAIAAEGAKPPAAKKQKVLVDFSSPNVAKEMHVGHLRSTIIGDTICRILEFCGHEVLRVNHVGDWGTQFGMLIGHLKNVFPKYATEPPPIADLQQFYKDAKKVFDDDEAFKKVAHEEVVRLQGGDGASRFAWQAICEVSRREFEKVYSRLGVELTEVGESYYNEYIAAVVAHLEQVPGLVSESDEKDSSGNATGRRAKVIFPPGSKNEHPLIVVKSDGGFGYDSTDMAAVWYRLLELELDWVAYVTDAGQGPHFELVFEAARAAGWATEQHRLDHVPFGLVCGEDGKKFKTRSGDVVRLVDLLDEAVERMHKGMVARNEEAAAAKAEAAAAADGDAAAAALPTGGGLSDDEMKAAARVLGYGAVKYADLKGNRNSNYIFSFDRMLDPRGDTAVYLLYAGARLCGILRKAGADGDANRQALVGRATLTLGNDAEMALGRELLRFQEVVERTTAALLPNYLCEYAYELCGKITDFYVKCKVLGTPEQDSRCILLHAALATLRKSFELLGIGFLERI